MGFWNDGLDDSHSRRRRSRSRSGSRSPSRRRSTSHSGIYSRPSAARSASSFLESFTGYNAASKAATPRRSNSNYGGHSSSTPRGSGFFGFGASNKKYTYGTHSRAGPRSGLVAKVRRWLRDLYFYMKKHPMKVFFLVIMPLITGGALTKILSTVGIKLPPQLERMMGSQMNRGYGDAERFYARGGARDYGGGTNMPGMQPAGGGLGGLGESAAGIMKMAKMFM